MKRILLIEPDQFLAEIYTRHLRSAGFDVAHAASGEEGMTLARESPPQLVLLDIVQPKKNGFQVLQELKTGQTTNRVPVAMITDLGAKEDVEQCFAYGACQYLIKSQHSPDDIVMCVRQLLGEEEEEKDNGFTLIEALVTVSIIIVAGLFAWFQFQNVAAKQRDAERLANVRNLHSALLAASQEHLLFSGCVSGDPVSRCRLCLTSACEGADDRTREYLSPSFFVPDGQRKDACRQGSAEPCLWAVEQDGANPLSLEHVAIRFFLEKGTGDLAGSRTHRIDPMGRVE